MSILEKKFDHAMIEIYHRSLGAGYKASGFYTMILNQGGLKTAKQLINSSRPSDGYTKLWELNRLDISVEAVVLENPKWHGLFSQIELTKCEKRLVEYGYVPRR